jgi:hypothetical protein
MLSLRQRQCFETQVVGSALTAGGGFWAGNVKSMHRLCKIQVRALYCLRKIHVKYLLRKLLLLSWRDIIL